MDAPDLNATVVEKRDLGERLAVVRIRPDAPIRDFEPGQFVQVGLPTPMPDDSGATHVRLRKRAYSIASSPAEKSSYEFYLALVDEGRLSPHLFELAPGDRCWVDSSPRGRFTLETVPHGADLVLVATGTGVAPFVSMLRTYARGGVRDLPERFRRCALIHGVRRASELGYRDELLALAARDERVCYTPIVSREPAESAWSGLRGRVQAVLEGERCHAIAGVALDPEHCHVLLCGNPDMIGSVRAQLEARGFSAGNARTTGNLHFERYW